MREWLPLWEFLGVQVTWGEGERQNRPEEKGVRGWRWWTDSCFKFCCEEENRESETGGAVGLREFVLVATAIHFFELENHELVHVWMEPFREEYIEAAGKKKNGKSNSLYRWRCWVPESEGRCFTGAATFLFLSKGRAPYISTDKSRCVDLWSEDGEAPVRFSELSISEHQSIICQDTGKECGQTCGHYFSAGRNFF